MRLFRENLISSILPTTLYLGDNVQRQMDNLWNKTASDGFVLNANKELRSKHRLENGQELFFRYRWSFAAC